MSNPSVTATISADDKASPKLRELVELTQRLANTAKAAFNDSLGGGKYAANFGRATSAAREHLTVLQRIQKVHHAIGATVAGAATIKAWHGVKDAVRDYLPYERGVRYQQAIQHYSPSDMALLDRQRINAATVYGLKPEDTLHAQMAFVTRNFSAPITEAATQQAIILSKALNVQTAEAAKIVEGITFGSGTHLHTPAQASREMARHVDTAAIAAKAGAMSPEDISQFAKFGIGMTTAAGIDAKQAYAAAMTLKRANVGGDESGVFMRQFAARLLAPTKQAFEAFAHMGIDYGAYAPQGNVSPDAIDASLRRRYGKGLSPKGKTLLADAIDNDDALATRESYTAAIRNAVEASGEKLSKMDQKHLTDTALRQYDLAKGGLKGDALFEDILQRASARDIQAILGDKQGGRATLLLGAREQYGEYREKLEQGGGFAQSIANERMQGMAAAFDRLTASVDSAEKQFVKANEGWLTPLFEAGAKVATFAASLSDATKVAVSAGAGLAGLASLGAVGVTIYRTIASLTSLAASAEVAAAALARTAGTSTVAAGASGAAAVAGASGMFPWLLGGAAPAVGIVGGTLAAQSLTRDDMWGVTRNRSRAQLMRDAIRADADERMMRDQGDADALINGGWSRRGVTAAWPEGNAPGAQHVEGNVNGAVDVNMQVQGNIQPTPYFIGIVERAQHAARAGVSGTLGTSMQGPGDNATKPSKGVTGAW